jgi:hypothetical protein
MKTRFLIALFAALPVAAQSQLVSFGVKGGVPAQTPLGQTQSKMPFVLGPVVELHLVSGLSLETGVLFDRLGQQSNTGAFLYPASSVTLLYSSERAHAIELPFLAKYRFLKESHTWRPFLSAGPTVRRTFVQSSQFTSILSGTSSTSTLGASNPNLENVKWNLDPAVGGGVDFKAGRFHLEPEVRYSYWGAGKTLPVRKNQVFFLLGFQF